ncbi:hypothetical protein A9266_20015 [Vibrio tasmaniensis]|nr:hypothetical protein A9266_20015 [Vibrio tasmaniensis]
MVLSKVVPESEIFTNYQVIDRKPFSSYLTSFLNTKADKGYVLNLNAEWGAGKTTFLHCWYNELSQNHPVIYFDAWKSDFSKDAMLALVDCFHAQLANPLTDNKKLIRNLFEKSGYFIKKSLPSLLVGYAKHKTGMHEDDSLIEDITTSFGIDVAEKECGDALKDVLKDILEQRQKVEGISEFKSALEALAKAVIEVHEQTDTPLEYPIYVLIDELDRCRPSYAIEVIESVKHFFDTKNFVFVIATDTGQLQHSIKAVYGSGFDAHSYLSRFFHRTVTLPPPSTKQYLISRLEPIIGDDFSLNEAHILPILVSIFEWHNMTSLREIDKIIQDVELAKSSNIKFKILPLILLSLLKRLHPDNYSAFIKNYESPYRYDNQARGTYHLPSNNSISSFVFNNDVSIKIEQALFQILYSIDETNPYLRWDIVANLKVNKNNTDHAIKTISFHYTFNAPGELARLPNYMQVLELGGHFD